MAATSSSLSSALRPTPTTPGPPSPQITMRPRVSVSGPGPTTPGATVPVFKVPAHKHAHHLHSIPPREKSSRTLILDHLLWLHARTRLQQARAELGMSVSAEFALEGAEGSNNSGLDLDPEENENASDGEEPLTIKFGARDAERNERSPAEDEHGELQNLPLAHTLRLRADGAERVLIAMLDQPPEVQPMYSYEDAPRTPPAIHGTGEHHFPNGVRLRLALSTLVNDLFARDVPTPLSPRSSNTPAFHARNAQTPSSTPHVAPVSSASKTSPSTLSLPPSSVGGKHSRADDDFLDNGLPIAAVPLASIASFSLNPERVDPQGGGGTSLPSISSFTRSTSSLTTDILPPIISAGASTSQTSQVPRPRRATGRVLALYEAGADPSTANSPPSLRCPRHLHHTCQICAPAKALPIAAGSSSVHNPGTSPKSPTQTRAAITLGSNGKSKTPGVGAMSYGLAPWKSGAGIGAGLAKPGVEGTVLRRRTISHHATSHPTAKDAGPCASGGKLVDLIPRFVRLSALVAVELGREAKDKEDEAARGRIGPRSDVSSTGRDTEEEGDEEMDGGSIGQAPRGSALKYPSVASPYLLSLSFRPTRDWYAMLAGLLTRAVLEGYLSRGWKGPQAMECLLGVGLGLGPNLSKGRISLQGVKAKGGGTDKGTMHTDVGDEFVHLDPDECPSLVDAAKILFPNLCKQISVSLQRGDRPTEGPEAEYEAEMLERMAEFLTVPLPTPDLSTHLEDLAYKFPGEPVERAIVRFCEAVASWRGSPELENYKKKSSQQGAKTFGASSTSNAAQMSIDSLVQSASGTLQSVLNAPRQPKAPIEKYFVPPPPPPPPSAKRRRSNTTSAKGSDHKSKKTHFESDDWTGPYGI